MYYLIYSKEICHKNKDVGEETWVKSGTRLEGILNSAIHYGDTGQSPCTGCNNGVKLCQSAKVFWYLSYWMSGSTVDRFISQQKQNGKILTSAGGYMDHNTFTLVVLYSTLWNVTQTSWQCDRSQ